MSTPPTSAPAIEAVQLSRSYVKSTGWLRPKRTEVVAVSDVTFEVRRGELFGLLGPNGAGKTTTIKMLNTLLLPTSGVARVLGLDVTRNPREVRKRIGYVFGGDRGLYDRLTARDNLRYFAEIYGVPAREQSRRIAELIELVGLTGRENDKVEGYSRGMRQRLHIARGLLHRPEVLFLDEPSIGVDPVAGRDLREMVRNLVATGTTVLLTTHYMAEADELCDRIAVITGGTIRALGTPERLKALVKDREMLEVETSGIDEVLLRMINELDGVRDATVTAGEHSQILRVHMHAGRGEVPSAVLAALNGTSVGRVVTRSATLEDAYVAIVESAGVPA